MTETNETRLAVQDTTEQSPLRVKSNDIDFDPTIKIWTVGGGTPASGEVNTIGVRIEADQPAVYEVDLVTLGVDHRETVHIEHDGGMPTSTEVDMAVPLGANGIDAEYKAFLPDSRANRDVSVNDGEIRMTVSAPVDGPVEYIGQFDGAEDVSIESVTVDGEPLPTFIESADYDSVLVISDSEAHGDFALKILVEPDDGSEVVVEDTFAVGGREIGIPNKTIK